MFDLLPPSPTYWAWHMSPFFVWVMFAVMLSAIGVVAARKTSRGDRGPWLYAYYGVLIYCFILAFGSVFDGMFVHPGGLLTPMGLAGLVSGIVVCSQGRHLSHARRAEEERRMFAQDL